MNNKVYLFFSIFCFLFFYSEAQTDDNLERVLGQMKTKEKPNYLSEYEWEVILYINYVRIFPEDFCNKELMPYSERVYPDKNASDYIKFVKPAIDRLLGRKNVNNTKYVKDIESNINLLGKVRVGEPSLAYTLAERDMLSDPRRRSHSGTNGKGWEYYASNYLVQTEESIKSGYPKETVINPFGEIAWPVLSESYTAKEAVLEWIIDRGNQESGYGHREIILTFDNAELKFGVAIHRNEVGNTNYPENSLALHVGFGGSKGSLNIITNNKEIIKKEFSISIEKEGINKDSKPKGLPFKNILRIPAK